MELQWPQWKKKVNFYIAEMLYIGLTSVLGIRIQIWADPELFGKIRILDRDMQFPEVGGPLTSSANR
jgi:hypothetical protein